MNKLSCLAVVLAIAGVMGADAQGAELEGALQYPPPSIGKDAQPPSPRRNGAPADVTAAHRIGGERVKPAARHATISDPPTDPRTWSTAVNRKRALAVAR
jgi:hypothetical protein